MKTVRGTIRPQRPSWNDGESFTMICGLAVLLSGLTYDHSAFEIRGGGFMLATAAAAKISSVTRYRRRLKEWRATADDGPLI